MMNILLLLLTITSLQAQVVFEFNYSGSIETWQVPYAGQYRIETYGAQGGGYYPESGGLGAKMSGDFIFNGLESLQILVGQRGFGSVSPGDNDCFCSYSTSGGGGGGTFVVLDDDTPLIISGGGGGCHSGCEDTHGLITTDGGCLISSCQGPDDNGTWGEDGNGGWTEGYSFGGTGAGGGGGFYTGGASPFNCTNNYGRSFMDGGAGGSDSSCGTYNGGSGGFGGGGAAYQTNAGASGGGGGYSGGQAGGGGGGSYNDGTNQDNEAGYNAGNGLVVITANYYGCMDPNAYNYFDDATIEDGSCLYYENIVINEVMNNPSSVSDNEGEWFEIYNGSEISVNLNGFLLKDNGTDSHVIGAELTIEPHDYLVFGNNADLETNGGVEVDYEYSDFSLGNSDDEIIIKYGVDYTVDSVGYDGGAVFPDLSGSSMALLSSGLDNSIGSNWVESDSTYGLGDLGTPGLPNFDAQIILSDDSLSMDTTSIGSSTSKELTLINLGSQALVISSISTQTSEFSVDTESGVVDIGNSLVLTITFSPNYPDYSQDYADVLTIVTDDFENPVIEVPLGGYGYRPTPQITFDATELNFGNVFENQNLDLSVLITNIGDTTLTISSISSNDFFNPSFTNTTIESNQSINLDITFSPTDHLEYSFSMTLLSDAFNNPSQELMLEGSGFRNCEIIISDSEIDFGDEQIGLSSARVLGIVNSAGAFHDLEITNIEVDDNVFQIPFTDTLIAPGAIIDLEIQFIPTTTQLYNSNLTIYSNDPTRPETYISLNGLGIEPNPDIFVNVSSIDFGEEIPVDEIVIEELTISSLGVEDLEVEFFLGLANDSPFSINFEDVSLSINESEQLNVSFINTTNNLTRDTLYISSNDPFNNQIVVPIRANSHNGPVWHVTTTGSIDGDGSEDFPYNLIQMAIDNANESDTVLVSNGTYFENINFNGKNIALIGEDRETTIIDGGQNGSVVVLNSNGILNGFTITNAGSAYRGGIGIEGGSSSIENCIISNNTSLDNGGGIHITAISGPLNIEDVIIKDNYASSDGGGIYFGYPDTCPYDLSLKSIIIQNNYASSDGGGIFINNIDGNLSIENITVLNNESQGIGGGMYIINSNPYFDNVTVKGNSAGTQGGGIGLAGNSNGTLKNVTITANNCGGYGGAFYSSSNASSDLINCIFWNNTPYELYIGSGSATISYSDIQGGEDAIVTSPFGDGIVNWIEGNMDSDPQFTDPGNDNYTLQISSPCIDAGDPNSPLDPDGTIADMGAYPYDQTYGCTDELALNYNPNSSIDDSSCEYFGGPNWFVSTEGVDQAGGGSELIPFSTIQYGIDMATDGDTVLVAAGAYVENIDIDKNIVLIGEERETTIIDGGGDGSVITTSGGISEIFVINLTVMNGSNDYGGGLKIYVDQIVYLDNMKIIDNHVSTFGGAIHIDNNSHLYIYNSLIEGNSASSSGGAISGDGNAFCTMDKVTVTQNTSNQYGAFNLAGQTSITNSIIYNNPGWMDAGFEYEFDIDACSNYDITYSIPLGPCGSFEFIDPQFTDPDNGDYTLQSTSPCIDSGDPNSELDPDGTIADMGAYYYDQTYGCTDFTAINYNANSSIDDGSCENYEGPVWYVNTQGSDEVGIGFGSIDAPFASIQHAIESSADGDTVLVAAGTYYENLEVIDKNVLIKSEEGELNTIIDGNQIGRVILISGNTEYNVELNGFTITNGILDQYESGGGLLIGGSNIESLVKIENCIISNTTTSAPFNGDSTKGGGIYITSETKVDIVNSIIENNYSDSGAGISITGTINPVLLENTLVLNNNSFSDGAGIVVYGREVNIVNCSIISNISETGVGGGIYVLNQGLINVNNSIIYNNLDNVTGCEGDEVMINGNSGNTAEATIAFSLIKNYQENICNDQGILNWLDGNIDAGPQFTDVDNGNFTLQFTSPCIDAGNPDLDGDGDNYLIDSDDQDPDGTRLDIGALYYDQIANPIIYGCMDPGASNYNSEAIVDDGSCVNNGPVFHVSTTGNDFFGIGTEQNPFLTIQAGIDASTNGDTVFVSEGTYYENNITNSHDDFILMSISGAESTIISNNYCSGFVYGIFGNNVIDGFTIDGGNCNVGSTNGLQIATENSPQINNCIIQNNSGSGVNIEYAINYENPPQISNCIFKNNTTHNTGSAITTNQSSNNVFVNNCTFINNGFESTGINYGAIHFCGNAKIVNSIFYANEEELNVTGCNTDESTVEISYSNGEFQEYGNIILGNGNINLESEFTDYENEDYTLQSTSPCIDAGDPESELDPDGTRADMGAFYYDQTYGCTDPAVPNYNPNSTIDDGSCLYDPEISISPESLEFTVNTDSALEQSQSFTITNNGAATLEVELGTNLTVTDIDGNIYETVEIGSQVWMKENLKVVHYNNGNDIATNIVSDEWGNINYGAYISTNDFYDEDWTIDSYHSVFGTLYNWYAVDDERGICPLGWDIPSENDWQQLESFLGISENELINTGWRGTNQGEMLKLEGFDYWNFSNKEGINSSGFSALGSGWGSPGISSINQEAFYHSSTENGSGAWYRRLHYAYGGIYRGSNYGNGKQDGFSVRCLRDIYWLSLSSNSHSIEAGASVHIIISVNADGLSLGDYSDVISITSNDPNNSLIELPVNMSVVFEDITPPTVSINTPTNASIGNATIVNWNATDNSGIDYHHLYFQSDSSSEFTYIDSIAGSLSYYNWMVPNIVSETAKFSIETFDLVGLSSTDITDTTFSIIDEISPEVTVTSPTAGTSISEYENLTISWTATDNIEMSNTFRVYYSNNGDTSFVEVEDSTFTIPFGVTDSAQVKIVALDIYDNEGEGLSDYFSVIDNTPPQVEIISPSSGDSLKIGSLVQLELDESDNVGITDRSLSYNDEDIYIDITFQEAANPDTDETLYTFLVPNFPTDNLTIRAIVEDAIGLKDTAFVSGMDVVVEYPKLTYYPDEDSFLSLELSSIDIAFSTQLDTLQLDGFTLSSSVFDATYYPETDNGVNFSFNIGNLLSKDTLLVELPSTLISTFGYSFDVDGDNSSLGDESKTLTYHTEILGDFDHDTDIDFDDLTQFTSGWLSDDYSVEIGPFTGDAPHLIPALDNHFDVQDLVAFIYMWDWSTENSELSRNLKENIGLPPSISIEDDILSIDLSVYNEQISALYISVNTSNIDVEKIEMHTEYDMSFYRALESQQKAEWSIAQITSESIESHLNLFSISTGSKKDQDIEMEYQILGEIGDEISTGMMIVNYIPIPDNFSLYNAYPNPFNPTTTIEFAISTEVFTNISIYDISGRMVETLVNSIIEPGYNSIQWNASNHASGIYFVKMVAGEFVETQKLMLVK